MIRICSLVLVTFVGGRLLAADEYMIKPKIRGFGHLSALQTTVPVRVENLEEEVAAQMRTRGFLVEKNHPIAIVRAEQAIRTLKYPDGAYWPGEAMKVPAAHGLENSRGEGQAVCVVDTGIDGSHKIFEFQEIETYNAINEAMPTSDGHGHGTFVASLAVGLGHPSAPAPASKLLAVKALGDDGSGTYADVVKAIEYCADKATVINLSLGGAADSEIMRQSIRTAVTKGVSVVAAVSNSGGTDLGYPASYPEVIAVTSVDKNLQPGRFSAVGAAIDIAAPGAEVWGALPGGRHDVLTGNSMATGFVSGVVALQRSRGAKSLLATDLGFPSEVLGLGLVNALSTAQNFGD